METSTTITMSDMCYYLLLLFGLKFLLGAEDRAHGCTREFLGHSDIALRSYAPTFPLARIRVDNGATVAGGTQENR